ncbi:RHS repeat-associated core domain-containing protein [Dyella choica]|uniref:Teneurin-like YD-shell domain-containing protein n=1 Tax=Dyella choica TaxID=1927959 RepID=A0A3S0RHR0_9GAMM|nr:RHS repeat-associated core domain-containing protein [Dyella choica]RUL70265.1 hypothetical protein EKH80_20850 [Dyella choica]
MKQGQAVKGSAVVNATSTKATGHRMDIGARTMMVRKPLAGLTLGMAMAIVAVPVAAQTANTKTTYTYDALDRLTQVTDPSGLNTTYQYDGLSDGTKLTSPDTGVTAKTYDVAGNVLTALDANGNTVTYTYDAQDRRLSASYADTTQNITYTYDEPSTVTGCTTSYSIGHLTRVVENAVTTVYCYNAQGYVIQKSQTVSGHTDVTSYSRSQGGKILGITHPSGNQVAYSYDADGHISGVTATTSSGTTTLVSNATYLPFGPVSGYTLGNGQVVARTYDANYRLTDLTSPAFTLHLARDAMGDITAIGNSPGANPATETYSYDPLYRLTAITEANGTTLESVTYNQAGDRLSKTGIGLATGAYGYNPSSHQLVATGNAARSVDANGNTTAISQAGSTYGFGYNARNRMVLAQLNQSTVAAYTYNAVGQRVAKTANSSAERYNYGADSRLLSEYGATNREYVYLDDIPVANLDAQGTATSVAYVTGDELGTPRAIADGSGNTVWSWVYQGGAWGEQLPISNGYTYNLRFPGQYFDVETGSSYNLNRDYDPNSGRYIESDPIGLKGGITTYAYVGSNSLEFIDPFGLSGLLVIHSNGLHDGSSGSGGTSGHSWITYTPDNGNEMISYGTWGNNPDGQGNGIHEDIEIDRGLGDGDASRSAHLDDDQESDLMDLINAYKKKGKKGWRYLSPCSSFAAKAWKAATGESLNPFGPYSNPSTLERSIIAANGGQMHGSLGQL